MRKTISVPTSRAGAVLARPPPHGQIRGEEPLHRRDQQREAGEERLLRREPRSARELCHDPPRERLNGRAQAWTN